MMSFKCDMCCLDLGCARLPLRLSVLIRGGEHNVCMILHVTFYSLDMKQSQFKKQNKKHPLKSNFYIF